MIREEMKISRFILPDEEHGYIFEVMLLQVDIARVTVKDYSGPALFRFGKGFLPASFQFQNPTG